jgi:hypothetical protein
VAQNSSNNGLPSMSGLEPTKFKVLEGSFCPTMSAETADHPKEATKAATTKGENLYTLRN